jgi:hypothetical protein
MVLNYESENDVDDGRVVSEVAVQTFASKDQGTTGTSVGIIDTGLSLNLG